MSNSKPKIRLRKKTLFDEYILTNKHIICKFKYLLICFDRPEDVINRRGLINLSKDRLSELLTEQGIESDTTKGTPYLCGVLETLKKWHPQISKIEIDYKNLFEVENLSEYSDSNEHIKSHLDPLPYNNCIHSDDEFSMFYKLPHKIIDIKVSFQLLYKIADIKDYKVNFNYLHQLLSKHILEWNYKESAFLDEVTINHKQLPYDKKLRLKNDELCYVYPSIYLIPLFPIEE